jgi:thioredoxin 1
MSMPHIIHSNDADFTKDVLESEKPVLVDFWAPWCGPCKAIAPILDTISEKYAEQLQVAKINVDENKQTPQKFGIRGIPALFLFQKGQLVSQKVGSVSQATLLNWLKENRIIED